ncbi:MAG: hypothetical protein QM756_21060 [Polyangiaceae bacterium]
MEVVDLDDVRVIETRRELRLFREHGAETPRVAVRRQNTLQNEKLERVLGAALLAEKDLRHTSRAQATDNLEIRKAVGRRAVGRLGHRLAR